MYSVDFITMYVFSVFQCGSTQQQVLRTQGSKIIKQDQIEHYKDEKIKLTSFDSKHTVVQLYKSQCRAILNKN